MRSSFRWHEDQYADPSAWWGRAELLAQLGPALAELHDRDAVTKIVGVATRGLLLGPLVARELGVGFVEIRKDEKHDGDHGLGLLRRTTPPDYAQRGLVLTMKRDAVSPRDHVLFVDDWIVTGAQCAAAARLIEDAGGTWAGATVLVDDTTAAVRRQLNVRSLLVERQLR